MRIGYARVSTGEQKLDLQLDELEDASCERVYQETISGAAEKRPELSVALKSSGKGTRSWFGGWIVLAGR
jgi:DNA invertase Pin-like site-specific DNA recombinase